MKKILITGSDGFIGKNLYFRLAELDNYDLHTFTRNNSEDDLCKSIKHADIIYHLAGENRPANESDFEKVNYGLTKKIIEHLKNIKKSVPVVFTSSAQAELNNPYGVSKRKAEQLLEDYSSESDSRVAIYRLPNVFGKWAKPNYNSVVATFCHNIAGNKPINISDPGKEIELVYIDDVIQSFIGQIDNQKQKKPYYVEVSPKFRIALQTLADKLYLFVKERLELKVPDLSDNLTRYLYSTFVSYIPYNDFNYPLNEKVDQRGKLVEILKSDFFGQVFISSTKPGIVRGNHYHHSKVEKFCVIKGEAVIRFRKIDSNKIIEYFVSGRKIELVDIPPGYTHNIENVGTEEMIVLFWANEIFNPDYPDTYQLEIKSEKN